MKTTERYEVVSGNRMNPGTVLAVFTAAKSYRCGGPATACLTWYRRNVDKPGSTPMFFRRVGA